MRPSRSLLLTALVALIPAGCGDDAATGPETITISAQANPAQQFDIVTAGGELRTTVLDGGGARTWLTLGDFNDEWDAALTLSGTTLTSTPVEASRPVRHYALALEGSLMTLTSNDATWDFTLSGAEGVAANQVIVFVRQ
ncbi:MAG: hypothetical protein P8170_18285 [Gemmatimonadota bacterium]